MAGCFSLSPGISPSRLLMCELPGSHERYGNRPQFPFRTWDQGSGGDLIQLIDPNGER
jgi:hypothetical protein